MAHRVRLVLTAVTIVLGAALVAGTFILTDSVQAVLGGAGATAPAGLVVVQPPGAGSGKAAGGPVSVPAGLAGRLRAVGGVAAVQGVVTAAKLTYLGPGGRPITHARAASELLSYPAAPPLAAALTRDQAGVATIAIPAGQLAAALAVTCLVALTAGTGPARAAGRVPALQAAIHD